MPPRRAAVVLAAYAALVAVATVGPAPGVIFRWIRQAADFLGLYDGWSFATMELISNVALFIPIGLLLGYALPGLPRWLIWAGCCAVSLCIELLQMVLPDRHASPVDVLTNSAGAAIGVLLQRAIDRRRRPPLA